MLRRLIAKTLRYFSKDKNKKTFSLSSDPTIKLEHLPLAHQLYSYYALEKAKESFELVKILDKEKIVIIRSATTNIDLVLSIESFEYLFYKEMPFIPL